MLGVGNLSSLPWDCRVLSCEQKTGSVKGGYERKSQFDLSDISMHLLALNSLSFCCSRVQLIFFKQKTPLTAELGELQSERCWKGRPNQATDCFRHGDKSV